MAKCLLCDLTKPDNQMYFVSKSDSMGCCIDCNKREVLKEQASAFCKEEVEQFIEENKLDSLKNLTERDLSMLLRQMITKLKKDQ